MTPRPPPPFLQTSVLAVLPGLVDLPWVALTGGRTNRLWRVGDVVVKAFDPLAASPLFPNDPGAEARALGAFGPAGLAPRLCGSGEGWLAYAHVEGQIWRGEPAAVARLLFRLHQHSGEGFRSLPSGAAALRAQGLAMSAECRASLPPPEVGDCPGAAQPRLLHGDAVAGNIIEGPSGLTLIDWQCPARGDPCEDIATFLSPAMQWLYRGRPLSRDEIARFLAAYPDPAATDRYNRLLPLFRWRMALHCQWKAERGAPDYAEARRLELGA